MLNSHPDIDWQGEIFHSIHESPNKDVDFKPYKFLARLIKQASPKILGIEVKFQHLDENGLKTDFRNHVQHLITLGFDKFVVIGRKNYLRQALSVARGQFTNTWHLKTDLPKPDFDVFELDPDNISLGGTNRTLIDCFESLDQTYSAASTTCRELGLSYLQLEYEKDLEKDVTKGFHRLLNFMELPLVKANVSLQKLESRPISEIISNHSQIRELLADTPYKWMCDS